MKRFYFIVGVLLIGVGLLVSLGTIMATIDNPSKFTPLTTLAGWILAGLLPFAIGTFLWFKSGEIKWGKTMFFFLGFIVSWGMWSTVFYVRSRPHDLMQPWSSDIKRICGDQMSWLSSASVRSVGTFVVSAASRKTNASAAIRTQKANFPNVLITDEDQNGAVDSIILIGAGGHSISVNLKPDGRFVNYTVSTGDILEPNAVAMVDVDMDGSFDIRVGPGRKVDVNINSNWYQRVSTNGKCFVEIQGVMTEVVMTNGLWKLKE